MGRTVRSRARRVRRRVLFAVSITGLLSGLLAAPASAGPAVDPAPFYAVPASAFAVTPAVGATMGDALMLWSNGRAEAKVNLPEPSTRLVFTAQARQCEGSPRLEVRIDGAGRFGFARDVAGSGDYAVAGDWAAGTHTVTLIMSNDRRLSAACDRNLKIRSVGFWGPSQSPDADSVAVRQVMDLSTATFAPSRAGVISSSGAAVLWSTGTFTGVLDSQAAEVLTIDLRATPCDGNPRFSLRIDGQLVTEPVTLSSGTSAYRVAKNWTDALYTIEIGFLNDFRNTTCDRNLEVLGVTFYGRLVS
jgi:hypothetical protein